MNLLSTESIEGTLRVIDEDLAKRTHLYELAARDFYRSKRDVAKKIAELRLKVDGTVQEKEDKALKELAYGDSKQMYADHIIAEAEFEAQKAAINTLIARSNIGLGLLKAQTRIG